jgi:DNA-binding NarL/FixJ family response regulator
MSEDRSSEIITMWLSGYDTKDISQRLGRGWDEATVAHHVARLMPEIKRRRELIDKQKAPEIPGPHI